MKEIAQKIAVAILFIILFPITSQGFGFTILGIFVAAYFIGTPGS